MTDQQSKLCSPHTGNIRFAAAMTEKTHEIERLCEVAYMFERMAHDTRRLAPHSRLTAGAWPRRQCSLSTDRKAGFIETWLAELLGRAVAVAKNACNGCRCCCSSHFLERLGRKTISPSGRVGDD